VVEFFVQVSIALLVFPVEMLARKGMQKINRQRTTIQRLFKDLRD
jgi:hypothetical protein